MCHVYKVQQVSRAVATLSTDSREKTVNLDSENTLSFIIFVERNFFRNQIYLFLRQTIRTVSAMWYLSYLFGKPTWSQHTLNHFTLGYRDPEH